MTSFRKNLKEHQIEIGWWIKAEGKIVEWVGIKRCQALVSNRIATARKRNHLNERLKRKKSVLFALCLF